MCGERQELHTRENAHFPRVEKTWKEIDTCSRENRAWMNNTGRSSNPDEFSTLMKVNLVIATGKAFTI